jgi:hypothetical protein
VVVHDNWLEKLESEHVSFSFILRGKLIILGRDKKLILEAARGTLDGTLSFDLFAPAHSALAGFRLRQTPFAGGLLRSRSVGLTAFASGKSFSAFPKCLKSQTAQVPRSSANCSRHIFTIQMG